ncbi:NADAR family protein [Myxococcota bacterium]|nr:NADAR family protein [Myxococcota bacterium]MBU1429052.1 NADAR family protein [Myxococcota bacterium]MBU1896559.1 NADAR family protein [Myxococcota bacterium]
MAIRFYAVGEEYGAFSNFSPHGFTLEDKYWPTSEHYFQAKKFEGRPREEKIRRAKGPGAAAKLGRSRAEPLRRDWEHVKEEVMATALQAKFDAHPDLKALLLSTGAEPLIEAAQRDAYWGEGHDGRGKNRLGALLMALRAAYQRQEGVAR